MKLKQLPTLRKKKRYIIFKIHSDGKLRYENVRNAIYNTISNWLGELGIAKADIHLIKNLWNSDEQIGFIRCSHISVDHIKTALTTIRQIGDKRVVFETLRVSGTIKSARKKLKWLNKPKTNSNL